MTQAQLIAERAQRVRELVCSDLTRWSAALDSLGAAVLSDINTCPAVPSRANLTATRAAAKSVVGKLSELFGAGFATDPNAFTDGLGLVWFTRVSAIQAAKPLEVDAEFYGYTTAPWWTAAMAAEEMCATGPYVDASGTGEHIVTFAKRIERDGDRIGVAGLDMRIAWFQDHLYPLLANLPTGSSITNSDGGVLATNSAQLLGRRYDPEAQQLQTIRLAPTAWLLVIGWSTGSID